MITKEQFYNYCSYPIKSLSSKKFYFDVLFKMKGLGLAYLLCLSFILAIPASFKINHVLDLFRNIELPRIVAMIPPGYIDQNGSFKALNEEQSYKEIFTSDGLLAVVFNVNDIPLSDSAKKAIVELNSKTVTIKAPTQQTVVRYTDLVTTGTSFDPLEVSAVADAVFSIAVPFIFVFLLFWFFCILVFNALVMAVLSKFLFIFVGKIKTSFGNTLRLSSFANTVVGVMLLIELIINVRLPFNLIMLLPLIYMILFIRNFRAELEKHGVDEFVRRFTPQGTTVKNYDQDGKAQTRKDISDFTDGLDSTTNKSRGSLNSEDKSDLSASKSQEEQSSDNTQSGTGKGSSSKTSTDSSGDGPGFFAP